MSSDGGHHRHLQTVHRPIAFEFANFSELNAGTGYDIVYDNDDKKFAHKTDDDTVWMLLGDSPLLWVKVGSGSGNTIYLDVDTDANLLDLVNGNTLYLDTQAANLVFAGPESGAAAVPSFRQLGYTELYLPPNQTSKHFQLLVKDGHPSTTNGCAAEAIIETSTNKQNFKTFDFDPTVVEYAEWDYWMPDDWDGGTIQFKYWWQPGSGANPGEVVVGALQCLSYIDLDVSDQAWGSAVELTDTVVNTGAEQFTGKSTVVTPGGSPVPGGLLHFRYYRNAVSGSDTMNAADMLLKGIKIYYNVV